VNGTRLASSSKRARRRSLPIMAMIGPNGGGKTAAMVWDTLPTLDAGRPVLSTVRLLDWRDPRPCEGWQGVRGQEEDCAACAIEDVRPHGQAHPLWMPFTRWEQLLEASRCDVLMDEVTGVASSRESHSMPAPVANALVQMRRADVVIRWSAPSWARADKVIRECTQGVTHCVGFMGKSAGDADRLWRQRRLFRWRTYDAALFDEFTEGKRQQMKPLGTDWAWGPGSDVFGAYDTYDAVLSIGTVTERGSCYRCGGSRPRPRCSCPADHPDTPDESPAGSPRSGVQAIGRRRRVPGGDQHDETD
jgi:hypothetical protein